MTRSLSIHSQYRCRHSGACCTSGWPIPVEADRLARLRAAMSTGALRPAEPDFADGDGILATREDGCVFYDCDARRCRVHNALGHDALPLACRQFPRVSLRDPRGVSITLSHFCPTAASLLNGDLAPSVVINAPAFPRDGEYIGLDATKSLPPLLRPDMLMDWNGWWEWEKLTVELLATSDVAAVGLARLSAAVEHARSWVPADGLLLERVRTAFEHARRTQITLHAWTEAELDERRREILDAIPRELRSMQMWIGGRPDATPARVATHLVAAHAFANWTAHLGQGLRTWLRSVEAPLVLLQSGMDVRTVDLWLRHLIEPKRLAEIWSEIEIEC